MGIVDIIGVILAKLSTIVLVPIVDIRSGWCENDGEVQRFEI